MQLNDLLALQAVQPDKKVYRTHFEDVYVSLHLIVPPPH